MEGLAGKTVILVTHQVEFLHGANLILVMRNGSIVQSGQFEELLAAGLDFESLVEAHNESLDKVATSNEAPLVEETSEPGSNGLLLKSTSTNSSDRFLDKGPSSRSWRSQSGNANGLQSMNLERSLSKSASTNGSKTNLLEVKSLKLIEEEERSSGQVSLGVYWLYLTAAYGGALTLMIMFIQFIWQGLLLAGDYWIAYETGTNVEHFDPQRFMFVYGMLAILCASCVLGRAVLIALMSLTTSQDFYLKMLRSLFRAPMSFFDTTPSGRILSRVRIAYTVLLLEVKSHCVSATG